MEVEMVGWKEGWMKGRMEGWKDGRIEGRMPPSRCGVSQ